MGCGQEAKTNYYCEFIEKVQLDDYTYSLDFKSDDIKTWHEGDHSMLIISADNTLLGKKLSYVTLPEEGVIRFVTRINGECSEFKKGLLNLVPGEEVKISEPAGDFRLRREWRPIVFLSGGSGITTIRPLIKAIVDDQTEIPEVLQLNVDARSDLFKEEFDEYKADLKIFNSYYLSHRTAYYGMLSHELRMMSKRHELKPLFYIAGSDSFVEENISYLLDLEFSKEDFIIGGKQADSCCRD